jgi:hypothetical protein
MKILKFSINFPSPFGRGGRGEGLHKVISKQKTKINP